jgi:hypothetical protein
MALNNQFKVKNDINVLGKILSGGKDLVDIFSDFTAQFTVSSVNDTTSFLVSADDAFALKGVEGITVTANASTETLIISGVNASTASKGVAKFDSNNFSVTNGNVSVASMGIENVNLDSVAVQKNVIDPANIVYSSGAINFTTSNGFSANVDNSTLEISNNKLQVKDDGITNSKLFYDYITFSDGTGNGNTALGDTFQIKGTANQITATFNDATTDNITFSLPNSIQVPGNLYVDSGDTRVRDLSVTHNLYVAGSATFANTIVTTTSSLSIINTGPTPALYVRNSNADYDIASFYDGDFHEVLHIGGGGVGGGAVGINVGNVDNGGYQPTLVGLTVNGSISASEIIYTTLYYTSVEWASVYTSVKTVSANWDTAYNRSTNLANTSAEYDSVYTSVSETSGSWDSVYTSVSETSANWDSNYTSTSTNSANWDSVYTSYNNASAKFISINTDSSLTSLAITNFSHAAVRGVYSASTVGNNNILNLTTLPAISAKAVKYVALIRNNTFNYRATTEIMAVSSNNAWLGTVYGLVDENNILSDVDISQVANDVRLTFYFNSNDNYTVSVVADSITGP